MLHKKSLGPRVAGRAAAGVALAAVLVAHPAFTSPDHPITRLLRRSPGEGGSDSLLAGEVDAKGLQDLVARQKGRVVLVNFWATWCVPCREEFPALVRLQSTLGPRGLQVIGVSTDFAKAMPAVETFLAQQRPNFPNFHKKSGDDDEDFINAIDKGWGGELPFSALYDRNGKKVKTLSARHSYREYEKEVLALLK